ncbi:MBL fold metallo-hydrolase [Anaerofustis stercorihominis]|uniref:Metallo-beta-lactamase domain-containing protein n=2 Tax=Anaerofustis stercorihominis TaxID=214853 RepID=B1C672_9FIRM|nr:MBL fold metallo-hydrolase [Anaerofustis stercorihominis]EDS73357.1 hypothetical protein ANASTE_00212 [Anaerofustis stercorihominis DSM 17244]MCQ4794809.1 MBL fold metallo-hydrolase [Anaerofustis stercorihominis]RGD75529.1 MBL fold metallo-hydrolase [Anaerofustis stercorihominis]
MAFNKKNVTLEYIANAGVLLENKGRKVLIDAVHTKHVPPYYNTDEKVLKCMIEGREPYDKIDVMIFTHHHSEHFDASAVCEILKNNRLTQLICTYTIRDMLKEAPNFDPIIVSQVHELDIPYSKSIVIRLKDIPFEAISMQHDGKNYEDVDNFAYYFEFGGKTFMHLGDSAPDIENFEQAGMFEKEIDVLFAPFPYIGLKAGRELINRLNPRRVIVVHLPNKEMDKGNWLYNTFRVFKKYERELPPTDFFTKPGEEMTIK